MPFDFGTRAQNSIAGFGPELVAGSNGVRSQQLRADSDGWEADHVRPAIGRGFAPVILACVAFWSLAAIAFNLALHH